jgi:hypothetical protein
MIRRAVVFLLLLALPARANLGDAVADCVKRYGKPVAISEASWKSPFGTMLFVAGKYQLLVFLLNNVEVGARVTKKDKSDFTPDEMATIMNADASAPWTPTSSDDPTTLQWKRADKATALYDKEKKVLIFTTVAMSDALHGGSAGDTTPADTSPQPGAPATNAPPRGTFAPAPPFPEAPPPPPPTNAPPADQ